MKRFIGKIYWLLIVPLAALLIIGLVDIIEVMNGRLERLAAWPAIAFLLAVALLFLWDIYGQQNFQIKYLIGRKARLIFGLIVSLFLLGKGLISLLSGGESLVLFGMTLTIGGVMGVAGSILANRAQLRAKSQVRPA